MNEKMSWEATTTYLNISWFAWEYDFINDAEMYRRLCYLYDLTEKDSLIHMIADNFFGMDLDEQIRMEQGEVDLEEIHEELENKEIKGEDSKQFRSKKKIEDSDIYHLEKIPGHYGAMWIFHQTDEDHRPTIPHGHSTHGKDWTLDPYCGYIYDGEGRHLITGMREPRWLTISLWNDEEFRQRAYECLTWHLDNQKHHISEISQKKSWTKDRVMKLPRIRKLDAKSRKKARKGGL
jgi:hypothetical protein